MYKTDVEHVVVLVKNIIKGSVSFSGVSEGDRSSPSGHDQLKVVLHAVLYTYTCVQDVLNISWLEWKMSWLYIFKMSPKGQ